MNRNVTKFALLPILIVIIVGFLLAVLGYEAMEHAQKQQKYTQFRQLAQEKSYLAVAQIDDAVDSLIALRAFYLGSEQVTANEFQLYAQHFLKHSPGLVTLLWVPMVSAQNRVAFERIHSNRQSAFGIYQWDHAGQKLIRSGDAVQYYPITYLSGKSQPELPIGLDLAMVPTIQIQSHKYPDKQSIIWVPLSTLTTTPTATTYYLALLPIEVVSGEATGYVGAVIDLNVLFTPLTTQSTLFPSRIQVTLGSNRRINYTQGSVGEPILSYFRNFNVAGNEWHYQQALLHSNPTFASIWPPLLVFLSLIILTGLLAFYIKSKAEQQQRTDLLVKLRTQELSHTAAQLKQQSLRLTELNTELQQFAYVAAHDLQAPLRLLQGYTQLVNDKLTNYQQDEELAEYLQCILQSTEQMSQLITGLLTYARTENGAMSTHSVDMNQVLQVVLAQLQNNVNKAQAMITYDNLPTVYGDQQKLIRLLQNLLLNAMVYAKVDEPAAIHVGCTRQRDEWIFSVQDNGIGIAVADQKRIFGLFQRLHSQDERPGTGIGLAICKKIVERYHGYIWLESTLDEGTTFFFSLPVGEMVAADQVATA